MECGSWCTYFTSKGKSGACTDCSAYVHDKPNSIFGEVNPFELAKKLEQKRETDRRKTIPQLSDCPKCSKHALFYNILDDSFSCLAIECKYTVASGTLEYKAIVIKFTR
ncbi:MAG: hypothetical protein WCC72_00600 [Dehalococcoidales bacterium]